MVEVEEARRGPEPTKEDQSFRGKLVLPIIQKDGSAIFCKHVGSTRAPSSLSSLASVSLV